MTKGRLFASVFTKQYFSILIVNETVRGGLNNFNTDRIKTVKFCALPLDFCLTVYYNARELLISYTGDVQK